VKRRRNFGAFLVFTRGGLNLDIPMQRLLVSAAAALAVLFVATGLQAASPEARYDAAIKVLSTCQYCFDIRDTPEDLRALGEAWTATQDWTLAYLNAHPEGDVGALNAVLLNAHSDYKKISAAPDYVTPLAPDLFGFGVGYNEIGNVFLVAKQNGRFRVVWDIRNLSASDVEKFPILRSWLVESARGFCRSKTTEGMWDRCSPIHGTFELLPPDSHGHIRFFLDSTYAQAAGETVGGQISIWSWDGKAAMPLFAKSYTYVLENAGGGFNDGLLKIQAKDEFKSYYSCGTCLGRQMDWTIRIDRDRVVDLGMKPVFPELDTVDALFYRLEKRRPAGDLIDPRAMAKLAPLLEPAQDHTVNPPDMGLNMIDYGAVRREKGHTLACVIIDELDSKLVFTVEKRKGHDFITDVASGAC
jgi:hypothetical protein